MHFSQIIDIFLHLDVHLQALLSIYGSWVYALLFIVVFCETGLVITPILPGDSLLFAAGSLAAVGGLNVHWLASSLALAAILGDSTNYLIGRTVGTKLFAKEKSLFFKKTYLIRAHQFYEKYGAKTIILARFIPIIRTFAPFVAGMAEMNYRHFLSYNILGGLAWVGLFIYGSYFFGNIPIVKNNFSIVIMAIIILSLLPPIIEAVRHKLMQRDVS